MIVKYLTGIDRRNLCLRSLGCQKRYELNMFSKMLTYVIQIFELFPEFLYCFSNQDKHFRQVLPQHVQILHIQSMNTSSLCIKVDKQSNPFLKSFEMNQINKGATLNLFRRDVCQNLHLVLPIV